MNIQVIIPMILFLGIIFFIGYWSSKKDRELLEDDYKNIS